MERNSLESVKLGKRERGGEREREGERGGNGGRERYQFTSRKIPLPPFRICEVNRSFFLEIDKQEIKLDDFVSKYTHNMYMYTIIILIL